MTFHEETTFKRSKEIECGPKIEEVKAIISKDHDDDSSPSNVQRENPREHENLPVIDEPIELVGETPTQRRSAWC